MHAQHLIWCLMTVALLSFCTGCGGQTAVGSDPTPVPTSTLFQQTPTQTHTVSGSVSDARTGGVAGLPVSLWVQTATGGYSYWFMNGRINTDSAGNYTAPGIPAGARITLFAAPPGYIQPCVAQSDVTGDVIVNIAVLSEGNLESQAQSAPPVNGPSLSGIVFEVIGGGRSPIAGAKVWAETGLGDPIATTRTDALGRFSMCSLPPDTGLTVQGQGYVDVHLVLRGPPPADVEIEMRR